MAHCPHYSFSQTTRMRSYSKMMQALVSVLVATSAHAQSSTDVGTTSLSNNSGGAGACVAVQLIPSVEGANGVSVFSDEACEKDATNCVPLTYCRKCKLYDTALSFPFKSCPPSAFPAVMSSSQVNCPSYLYPEEPPTGISAIYDAQCPIYGGKGCISNGAACRRCLVNASSGLDYHPCDLNTCLPSAVVTLKGAVGILDPRCNDAGTSTLVGCIPFTSCRLCRLDKNEDNAYLPGCAALTWPTLSGQSGDSNYHAAELSVAASSSDVAIPWPNVDVNLSHMTAAIQSFSIDVGQDVFGKTMANDVIISVVLAVLLVLIGIAASVVYVKCIRVKAVTTIPIISKPGTHSKHPQIHDPEISVVV
ncbi:hypothetical protein DYB37_000491 [Aphanomyces astaci]|uniref:TNFR-Cys domain-containing protein n=1 Tax=Aphanomyces astaci TaxID=112090 RepID=A0A3R6XAL9_APHAT|nr:hypothetical protein DYB35_003265 [Aphanomyces astaci]RHZ28857.1 hypothetical protein DYB37_000491 [Aphanomyces astaci]